MKDGYTEFEFDLPDALLQKLINVFNALPPAPMREANVSAIPEEQGVYQLFLVQDGQANLVYVGKTDAAAGLQRRLLRHAKKIQNRQNLDPGLVLFKAVRVFVFTAVDLETQLIKHYGGTAEVRWNGSGFGSNDPGEKRDTTTYKADHFDTQFPIDIDRSLSFLVPQSASAATILKQLKGGLPYLIRFQRAGKNSALAHPDLEATEITLTAMASMTPRDVISQTVRQLPPGWHATMLPSHIIIYKDDRRVFPSGHLIART